MKKGFVILISCLIIFASCSKPEEIEGPALNDLYGPFYVEEELSSTSDVLDFSGSSFVDFTAKFSRQVEWKLRLKGLSSGAEKIITGKSSSLDGSNTRWRGTISNFPVFKVEQVAIELTFVGVSDTLRDSLSIVVPRTPEGTLITSFETGTGGFVKDNGGGGSISYLSIPLSAPYGNTYASFASGLSQSGIYKSSLNISAGSVSFGSTVFPFPSDTSNVYLNLIVYGSGAAYNGTKLAVSFWEDDNGNGSFSYGDSEDIYEYVIQVNWVGWKVVSFPYKSIVPATYAGRNGNHVKEPHKISSIVVVHNGAESSLSKADIDFLVITQGKIFEP